MTQNKNYDEVKSTLLNIEAKDLSSLSLGSDEDGNLYRHDGSTSISTVSGSSEKAGLYLWDNSEPAFKKVSGGALEELDLKEQDLSNRSLDSTDDGTVFYHDGSNPITTISGTSTREGLYEWDNSQSAFKPIGLNEDISPTWTDSHIFEQGLATGGDITSLALGAPIWDESNQHIPQDVLENSSITLNVGNGLSGDSSVALGNSLSLTHADTSSQADLSLGSGTVVSGLTLDEFGHITNTSAEVRNLNDWAVPNQVNISTADRFQLPNRTSDPSANPGDMWYRTDLD